MGTMLNYFILFLMCISFVGSIHGLENAQDDISTSSKSYFDFINEVSMKVQHAKDVNDPKTLELAETLSDALYEIFQPVKTRMKSRRNYLLNKMKAENQTIARNDDDDVEIMINNVQEWLQNVENNNNMSSTCINDTGRLITSLLSLQSWAIQFFDATGKPGPALLEMHLNWVGNYDQCRAAVAPPESDGQGKGFKGDYCVVSLATGNPFLVPQIGTCMPSTCSSKEISILVTELLKLVKLKSPISLHAQTECRSAKTEMTTATVFAIIVLVVVGIMMILGTTYDVFMTSQTSKNLPVTTSSPPPPSPLSPSSPSEKNNQNGYSHIDEKEDLPTKTTNGEATPLLHTSKNTKSSLFTPESSSAGSKVLLAFSVYSNGKKLFNTSQAPGSLGSIHGIRFLSMSWVVMCHTYSNIIAYYMNSTDGIEALTTRWTFLPISNGFVSVDTFFTLSGLLTSYLTIKEMTRKNSWKINWPMFYFHRFWRLTPPYMLSLLIVLGLSQYLGQGPLWLKTQPQDKMGCENNWWTNLLYINNLVKTGKGEGCFGHSWYLANDMQFFVLSPFMLIPFYFSRLAGMLSCLGFLLITTITTGALSTEKDWPTTMVLLKTTHTGAATWFVDYYIKPWCRIGPFIVGIAAGYILALTKGRPFKMHWLVVVTGWITAVVSGISIVYGLHGDISGDDPSSTAVSALYNAVNRTIWGGCISWVIIACSAGYGGPVNTLLSWSPFVFLGRLTYMSYLIHLCIVGAFFQNLGSLLYYNDTTMAIIYLGLLLFVNMAAFLFVLGLESPMLGLEKAFLRPARK